MWLFFDRRSLHFPHQHNFIFYLCVLSRWGIPPHIKFYSTANSPANWFYTTPVLTHDCSTYNKVQLYKTWHKWKKKSNKPRNETLKFNCAQDKSHEMCTRAKLPTKGFRMHAMYNTIVHKGSASTCAKIE